MDAGNEDMDEGNQDTDKGSQDMDEDNEEQEPHISPPNPLPQEQPQSSNQFVPQTQFTPSFSMQQQYWGMSQFETGEGGSFSQLLGFMAADAAQSQYGHQVEFMPGRYSLDARYPGHTSSVASGGSYLLMTLVGVRVDAVFSIVKILTVLTWDSLRKTLTHSNKKPMPI
ncbi:uncharacterized protein LOC110264722 isoform X1 [Arachis ipaensis]|uniref:uncharacterized protein LOC110264722 isoform X1 n=1 Tax=Arachis ipaensis TaxID=130454 RepID=UPI000A2B61DA|nr:uncharacterized protein LOC110264722 isoform X1 [Arachis ipaensis]